MRAAVKKEKECDFFWSDGLVMFYHAGTMFILHTSVGLLLIKV